jgi:hypothetical protein
MHDADPCQEAVVKPTHGLFITIIRCALDDKGAADASGTPSSLVPPLSFHLFQLNRAAQWSAGFTVKRMRAIHSFSNRGPTTKLPSWRLYFHTSAASARSEAMARPGAHRAHVPTIFCRRFTSFTARGTKRKRRHEDAEYRCNGSFARSTRIRVSTQFSDPKTMGHRGRRWTHVFYTSSIEQVFFTFTVKSVGAKWVRFDIKWQTVEPTEGTFDWSATDAVVNTAQGYGVQVLDIFGLPPRWACVGNPSPECRAPSLWFARQAIGGAGWNLEQVAPPESVVVQFYFSR